MNIYRISPQRDVRLMYAEPKNKCWDHVDPACGPKLYECHNSKYRMGQCLALANEAGEWVIPCIEKSDVDLEGTN